VKLVVKDRQMHFAEFPSACAVDLTIYASERAAHIGINIDPDAQTLGASGNHRVYIATFAPLPAMIGDYFGPGIVGFRFHDGIIVVLVGILQISSRAGLPGGV
jgi:hypothetical protein